MPATVPPTEVELGGLTAWSRAQQAALYHRHIVEQSTKDEAKAEKDEKEKKEKKKKDDEVKLDKITAATILANILQGWCPALYEFLDIFGPPHAGLPVFIALHILAWATLPWYLIPLLPLPLTHLLPMSLSLKSLFSPAATLEKAYDDAKRRWQKQTEDLKKQGKDKADFPDPPKPPAGWQLCVRDRAGWLAYWSFVGGVEYLESVCFGDQIKAVFFVSLYFIWETDEKGHQTTGAMKLIEPFLPKSKLEQKDADKSKDRRREK